MKSIVMLLLVALFPAAVFAGDSSMRLMSPRKKLGYYQLCGQCSSKMQNIIAQATKASSDLKSQSYRRACYDIGQVEANYQQTLSSCKTFVVTSTRIMEEAGPQIVRLGNLCRESVFTKANVAQARADLAVVLEKMDAAVNEGQKGQLIEIPLPITNNCRLN